MSFLSAKRATPALTPEEVFDRYAELVASGSCFATSIGLLPTSKTIIKEAIIKKLGEGREQADKVDLIRLYLKLSNFQRLSSAEQGRIHEFLLMIGATWAKNEDIDADQKRNLTMIFGADHVYGKVVDRIWREEQNLKSELFRNGHLSKSDLDAEAQHRAEFANAMAEKIGLTMKLTADDFKSVERDHHA